MVDIISEDKPIKPVRPTKKQKELLAFIEAFIAEHGSWNRRLRSGYDVVFLPFRDSRPAGAPTPFLSGFVTDPARREVYGRLSGVAMLADGSLNQISVKWLQKPLDPKDLKD